MKKLIVIAISLFTMFIMLSVGVSAASERESNNTAKTANTVQLNTTVTGSIATSSDVDWYKIVIKNDGVLSIDFKHEDLYDSAFFWEIHIYESDATTEVALDNWYYIIRGSSDYTFPDFGLPSGTYYISVTDHDKHSSTTYSMTLNFSETDCYEKENNSEKSKATFIEVNKDYFGAINYSKDTDWYKFIVSKDGVVSIEFNHDDLKDSETYWAIQILESDGKTIIFNTTYLISGDENRILPEMGLAKGTYYIKIYDYDNEDASLSTYNLKVNYSESDFYEKEQNDESKKATQISLKTDYYGAINASADKDYYKFYLEKDMEIMINFMHPMLESEEVYWNIEFYNSDGKSYVNNESVRYTVKGNANRVIKSISLKAGTYYMMVYKGDTLSMYTYQFNIYEAHKCLGDFVVTTSPTCTESGIEERICSVCGSSLESRDVSPTGHISEKYILITDPSCSREGSSIGKCIFCEKEFKVTIEKLAHEFGDWIEIAPPKCDIDGSENRICCQCGYIEERLIEHYGHKFGDWIEKIPAKCGVAGTEEIICEYCGSVSERATSPLDHKFDDWKTISGNVVIPPIVKEQKCVHCGFTETVKDWSYIWVTVLAVIAVIGLGVGVVSYFKAYRNP